MKLISDNSTYFVNCLGSNSYAYLEKYKPAWLPLEVDFDKIFNFGLTRIILPPSTKLLEMDRSFYLLVKILIIKPREVSQLCGGCLKASHSKLSQKRIEFVTEWVHISVISRY